MVVRTLRALNNQEHAHPMPWCQPPQFRISSRRAGPNGLWCLRVVVQSVEFIAPSLMGFSLVRADPSGVTADAQRARGRLAQARRDRRILRAFGQWGWAGGVCGATVFLRSRSPVVPGVNESISARWSLTRGGVARATCEKSKRCEDGNWSKSKEHRERKCFTRHAAWQPTS